MLVADTALEPEIDICGTGESFTGSLNVAFIVMISSVLYGPVAEYVMSAVSAVASTVNVPPDVGVDVTVFPAVSCAADSVMIAVPLPDVTVWE